MSSSVILRPATVDDRDLLLEWRNDPVTIAMSLHSESVTPAAHDRWLAGVLRDDSRTLLIGEADDTPIGSVRLDAGSDGTFEVSIVVSPAHRGRGLGRAILAAANSWAFDRHNARRLVATVKEGNTPSRQAFEKSGYRRAETRDGLCRYLNDSRCVRGAG